MASGMREGLPRPLISFWNVAEERGKKGGIGEMFRSGLRHEGS